MIIKLINMIIFLKILIAIIKSTVFIWECSFYIIALSRKHE